MLNKIEQRVIDITYKNNFSHLSSNLTSVGLIDKIYLAKRPKDKFVLSCGHAFLALAVVLEKSGIVKDAEDLVKIHGVHPNRDPLNGVHVSTGSLGQGLSIAVGMAIADKDTDTYCLVSDGELAEGICWEALRIAGELRLENLKIMVNANGYSAFGKVDTQILDTRLQMFYPSLVISTNLFKYPDWLQGVNGHYVTLDKDKYEEILKS